LLLPNNSETIIEKKKKKKTIDAMIETLSQTANYQMNKPTPQFAGKKSN
jgi:hypothetical protein